MDRDRGAEIGYFRMRSGSGDSYYRVDLAKPVGEQVQWLDNGAWVETEFEDLADFLRNTNAFNPGAVEEIEQGDVPASELEPQGRDTAVNTPGDDPPDQDGDVSGTPRLMPPDTPSTLCDRCKNRPAELLAHFPGIRARPPRWCPDCAGTALGRLVRRGLVVTVTSATHAVGPALNGGQPTSTATVSAGDDIREPGVADLNWTVDRAVRMLRLARPAGSVFLRALVDEGGTATAARLRELTGAAHLHPMTQTLNASMKKVFGGRRLNYEDRHLAHPNPDPEHPRRAAVYSYSLPPDVVPILDQALRQLGR
jgi:hypothetical protein